MLYDDEGSQALLLLLACYSSGSRGTSSAEPDGTFSHVRIHCPRVKLLPMGYIYSLQLGFGEEWDDGRNDSAAGPYIDKMPILRSHSAHLAR